MTAILERLLGGDALGDALDRLRDAAHPRLIVPGWATVELGRAEVEVGLAVGGAPAGPGTCVARDAPDERVLGARCRILRWSDGREVVLLEPSTEGPLAAALARYGEGSLVRYLLADGGATERARRAGFRLGSERPGPFGRERLVVAGPRWGPYLLLAGLD
jgi:hypothetical protein